MNGYDCFMQSMDWELRREGFPGFLAQIVLELEGRLSEDALRASVDRIVGHFPVLRSRRRRALPYFYPYWSFDPDSFATPYPRIRTHVLSDAKGDGEGEATDVERSRLHLEIFNVPLDAKGGELLRFDLISRFDRTDLVMTWHHPLMDSQGAEKLLALVARPELEGPEIWREGENFANSYTQRLLVKKTFKERMAESRGSLENVSACSRPAPVSLYAGRRASAGRRQGFHVVRFSPEETRAIAANASALCGALRTSDYFLWATLVELDRLQRRMDVATPSYVITLPVDMRPKGGRGALFSTQESTLFYHIDAETLADRDKVLESLRAQTTQAIRKDWLRSFLYGMEISRPFPAWFFMMMSRNAMKGEIGSLFFANIARNSANLTEFLGSRILDFSHVPAVAAPPGIGVFFYRFGDALKCTIVYVEGMLSEEDAEMFAEGLKSLLLRPDQAEGPDRADSC